MPAGTNTTITELGYAICADRMQTTPSGTAPKYVAIGTGASGASRTAAVSDTALTTEVETRAIGIESTTTTTITGDTYRVTGVITATAPRDVDECALFDAAAAGNMFLSATFAALITLATNDSVQLTCDTKFSS